MTKKITIKEVAREAGVSISTVSRFLNQNYSSMSSETKDRIEAVIQQLNYHPNKLAQGLKGQSRTIAVVVVNIGYPFCVSIIRSISDVLNHSGFSLLVCETGGDTIQELSILQSLEAQGVDGVILQTNGSNNDYLSRMAKSIPVVLIDRQFTVPRSSNVVTNNYEASKELTASLFAEGYQDVLFVSEELQGLSTRTDRLNGYRDACSVYNKEQHVHWVNRKDLKSFRNFTDEIQKHKNKPFAVYTSNGLLMLELYPMLHSLGKEIPTELGLATFDEPDWVKITKPTLTCVRQPTPEMGQLAATTILNQIQQGQVDQTLPSVQVISSEVIMSDSTKLR